MSACINKKGEYIKYDSAAKSHFFTAKVRDKDANSNKSEFFSISIEYLMMVLHI